MTTVTGQSGNCRSAPTTPGNVYAATAPPTHSPAVACGASSMASHATATKLIPSPRYDRKTSAEGAQRRAADREADLGDTEVATTQQRHRPLDTSRHPP